MAVADRDSWCDRLSELTGLPVLDGWSPGGTLWSRGIRFANGPFLDIHNPPPDGTTPEPSLLLRGDLQDAEALARQQGWHLKTSLRSDAPQEQTLPWSLGYFGPGQGMLSRIGLIDYEIDPATCGNAEFAGPLFALGSEPRSGARLERVWIAVADVDRAALELSGLGFRLSGDFQSRVPPGAGRLLCGEGCDLVICEGGDGMVRLDVSGTCRIGTLQLQGVTVVLSET
jgi:hypothetical protein